GRCRPSADPGGGGPPWPAGPSPAAPPEPRSNPALDRLCGPYGTAVRRGPPPGALPAATAPSPTVPQVLQVIAGTVQEGQPSSGEADLDWPRWQARQPPKGLLLSSYPRARSWWRTEMRSVAPAPRQSSAASGSK